MCRTSRTRSEIPRALAERCFNPSSTSIHSQVASTIESCYEQIRSFVNKALEQENMPALSDADQAALKNQVLKLANKTSPVPSLMGEFTRLCNTMYFIFNSRKSLAAKRLDGYVRVTLRSNGSIPPPPSGFADYQEELVAFIASFRRLVSYNHAVFGEHFHQILNKTLPGEETEATTSTASGINPGQAQTAKP